MVSTRELVGLLDDLAHKDLAEGADIVDHPAHIAALTITALEAELADLRRIMQKQGFSDEFLGFVDDPTLGVLVSDKYELASEEERELMLAQSIEWLKSYVDGNGSVAEDFAATLIFRHREMQSLEKYTAVLAEQLDSANERVRHYITKTDDLTKQLEEDR